MQSALFRLGLAPTLFALVALSGCTELGERYCTDNSQCRYERVCASGVCVDPTGSALEPDAGTDADARPDAQVTAYDMQVMKVTDQCAGELHTAEIVLTPETDARSCEVNAQARIIVRIEGALDLNSQTPGSTSLRADGISVRACEGNSCVQANSGSLELEFYEPGEIVSGRLIASFTADPSVSARFTGTEYDIELPPNGLTWCGFADDQCRF